MENISNMRFSDWITKMMLLTCILNIPLFTEAQLVLQSPQLNIRGTSFYDVLMLEDGKSAIYRSSSNEHLIDVFDDNLRPFQELELIFEDKKINVESISTYRNKVKFVYSHKAKGGNHQIKLQNFDHSFLSNDSSIVIADFPIRPIQDSYKSLLSEDKSKMVLFGIRYSRVFVSVIDYKSDSLMWSSSVEVEGRNTREDFRGMEVSNEGDVYFVLQKNNSKLRKKNNQLFLYRSSGTTGEFTISEIDLSDIVTSRIRLSYDDLSDHLVIAGLYGKRSRTDLRGYFTSFINSMDAGKTYFHEFESDIYTELFGMNPKKRQRISDFNVENIIHRQDGGCILISEFSKEFLRRPAYASSAFNYAQGMRGFVDYYHEDLILFSVAKDGVQDWRRTLYKKQFSQDDGGVYSSFFLMTNPSRMKVVYNDEIKDNNTVSEYVLSPSGRYQRNAILNTEYQDFQLRLKDAIQVSNHQIIVPSEKNGELSLVMIDL